MIRKARKLRHWNQERLGLEAKKFTFDGAAPAIDKSTVSKIENDPFSSEFGTVWRLVAALGLTLADVERRIASPFAADQRLAHRLAEDLHAQAPSRATRRRKPTGT